MKDRFLKTAQRLYQRALDLHRESDKRVFLTIFAGLGTLLSIGMGGLCQHILQSPYAFISGMSCSSFVLLPASMFLGMMIWDKWQKSRALSGDPFAFLKYLKDDYERDIQEIRDLKVTNKDKRFLMRQRYDEYVREKSMVRHAIRDKLEYRRLLPPEKFP